MTNAGFQGDYVADRELEGSVPETGARGVKGLLAATVALLLVGGVLQFRARFA
jgi:hypothetical protein